MWQKVIRKQEIRLQINLNVFCYIYSMAKAIRKKSAKEEPNVFHSTMAAFGKGNPTTKKNSK